jgi:hypothetical protein
MKVVLVTVNDAAEHIQREVPTTMGLGLFFAVPEAKGEAA